MNQFCDPFEQARRLAQKPRGGNISEGAKVNQRIWLDQIFCYTLQNLNPY